MDLITLCFMSLGPGPRKSSGPLPLAEAEEVTLPHRLLPLSWNRSLDKHYIDIAQNFYYRKLVIDTLNHRKCAHHDQSHLSRGVSLIYDLV